MEDMSGKDAFLFGFSMTVFSCLFVFAIVGGVLLVLLGGLIEIEAFGWQYERTGYGLLLTKENKSYVIRPWPLDIFGRASEKVLNSTAIKQNTSDSF